MSTDTTSTLPAWLTDAEQLATAATPASTAVSGVTNLLTELLKLGEPILADDETHKYDTEVTTRLRELVGILAQADGDPRADKLSRYFSELCIDAGTPAIGLGPDLNVPVAFVVALASAALNSIRDKALLTDALAKANAVSK
jgi:hypothetical protein